MRAMHGTSVAEKITVKILQLDRTSKDKYSHGIKKRPFFTYVEMCFYHIILECPYEGVSFVFADKFTNILTILLDKCTTIDFCTMQ